MGLLYIYSGDNRDFRKISTYCGYRLIRVRLIEVELSINMEGTTNTKVGYGGLDGHFSSSDDNPQDSGNEHADTETETDCLINNVKTKYGVINQNSSEYDDHGGEGIQSESKNSQSESKYSQNETNYSQIETKDADTFNKKTADLSKVQVWKKLLLCSALMLMYTPFQSAKLLQSTLNKDQGIGSIAMGCAYIGKLVYTEQRSRHMIGCGYTGNDVLKVHVIYTSCLVPLCWVFLVVNI